MLQANCMQQGSCLPLDGYLATPMRTDCTRAKVIRLWPQKCGVCWCVVTCVQVITRILQSSTPAVKLRATDILLSALAHDPMPLRNFLASTNGRQLLASLVMEFVSSDESGLPEQIAELLKLLVDPGGAT